MQQHLNIALLEDNAALLELMKSTFKLVGHNVQTYTTGPALLEVFLAERTVDSPLPYDLVIVDLNLPGGMSGLEVIRRIYQIIDPKRLPIIIVSGAGLSELEHAQTILPHVPLLRKPFKLGTLLQLIETMCRA